MGGSVSDNLDLSVVLRIAAQGGAKTTAEVQSLQDAVDDLARAGALGEKEIQGLTTSLSRMDGALKGTTLTTNEASKAEQRLLKAQRDRAKIEAGELNRSMNANMKARQDTINSIQQEIAATEKLAQARNAERASASARSGSGIDSRLGGSTGAPRAADTGLAAKLRKEEADAIARGSFEAEKSKVALRQEEQARQSTLKSLRETIQARHQEDNANQQSTESLAALRYANYDIAATYGVVSGAITALGIASINAFTEMESGFTKVERTSGAYGEAFAPIEQDLLQLSRTLPVVTEEIQDLAARGAQMGIAGDKVAEFAEVMAKFVATSPEVDVNSVAEAFGRISNLTGVDDFEALASSIANVGVNSAATDAQIIKTTQELSRAAGATAFTAAEIVGLSAAFASLGVAPEAARGVMNQFITTMNRGAAGLTDSMDVAAQYIGVTTEKANELWKSDPSQFFQRLVGGLSTTENLTTALDGMGLQGQRLVPLFSALTKDFRENADGASVLANALADANAGFAERGELDRQYAPIADDLRSKQTLLANSIKELAYTFIGQAAPAIKGFMEAVTGAITVVTDFINTPVGGFISRMVMSAAGLVAAYAGLRAMLALATASMLAFQFITKSAGGAVLTLSGGLKSLMGGLRGVGGAGVTAGAGVNYFGKALMFLGKATIIIGVLQLLVSALSDIPGTAMNVGKAVIWLGNAIEWVANKLASFWGAAGGFFKTMSVGASGVKDMGQKMIDWGKKNQKAEDSVTGLNTQTSMLNDSFGDMSDAAGTAGDALGGNGGGGGKSVADGADEATTKIRTLLDYASDLNSVMSRAFEIRFSSGESADKIAKTFIDLRNAAADSAQKIRDIRTQIKVLQGDLRGLQSDLSTQQYFLSIALEYGDSARAEAIQGNIAKLQGDIASKQNDLKKSQADLTKEQQNNSKALTGNTEAAIKNRDTLRGLVRDYQSQIEALAKSGMSQKDLSREVERLRKDFIRQATQLGFNREELREYEKGFDDAAFAVKNIPRDVTIDINANPALTALQELQAQIDETEKAMSGLGGGGGGIGGGGGLGDMGGFDPGMFDMPPELSEEAGKSAGQGWFDGFWQKMVELGTRVGMWFNELPGKIQGFVTGAGITVGTFFSGTVPGWLSNIGTQFGNWFRGLPGQLASTVTFAAVRVWDFITQRLGPALGTAFNTLGTWFRNLPARTAGVVAVAANSIWTYMTQVLPGKLSGAFSTLSNWFRGLGGRLSGTVGAAGTAIWRKLADIGSSMGIAFNNIARWFRNLPANIWNTISQTASSIWNQFADGIKDGASRARGKSGGRGKANGGYTGPGPKYAPAGVVHRGEYVIPKKHVNQSTGLPNADVLGKLIKGSPSPSYAQGGYVAPNPGFGVVDLSAQSIKMLARELQPHITIGDKMVGNAASRSYARDNRVGAN